MAQANAKEIRPPAEAALIKRHRLAKGLSVPRAAALTGGVVSASRWTQIEQGYMARQGGRYPTSASDSVLAHMAAVVDVSPEQLEGLGKREAADVLRTILERRPQHQPEVPAPPDLQRIVDFFADPNVPAERRRRVASRFLAVMPYIARGEPVPPELLNDDNGENSGRETA